MRFQAGIGSPYERRPRGKGHGQYSMSRAAYQARVSNLVAWRRPRTYEQTRRIEIEIALATHRKESFRAMAKRLDLSSWAYCWRVARKYRSGRLRMLPLGEQELVAFRDSLCADSVTATWVAQVRPAPKGDDDPFAHARGCHCRTCSAKAGIDAALRRAAGAVSVGKDVH